MLSLYGIICQLFIYVACTCHMKGAMHEHVQTIMIVNIINTIAQP